MRHRVRAMADNPRTSRASAQVKSCSATTLPPTRWSVVARASDRSGEVWIGDLNTLARLYRPVLIRHLVLHMRLPADRAEEREHHQPRRDVEAGQLAVSAPGHGRSVAKREDRGWTQRAQRRAEDTECLCYLRAPLWPLRPAPFRVPCCTGRRPRRCGSRRGANCSVISLCAGVLKGISIANGPDTYRVP